MNPSSGDLDAELRGCPRGVFHLPRSALPHAFGVAVCPNALGQDGLVAFVDRVVADCLANEVVGDGPDLEVVLAQQIKAALVETAVHDVWSDPTDTTREAPDRVGSGRIGGSPMTAAAVNALARAGL